LWAFGASAGAANPADATVPGFPPTRVPPEAPPSNPLTEPTVPDLPGRPPWRDPAAESPKPAAETVSDLTLVRVAVLFGSPNPEVSTLRSGATGRVGDVPKSRTLYLRCSNTTLSRKPHNVSSVVAVIFSEVLPEPCTINCDLFDVRIRFV